VTVYTEDQIAASALAYFRITFQNSAKPTLRFDLRCKLSQVNRSFASVGQGRRNHKPINRPRHGQQVHHCRQRNSDYQTKNPIFTPCCDLIIIAHTQ
jgi:hypothetical protein